MDHLLNFLAVHRSRTPRDLKKERLDQVNLLLSKHHPGEIVTAHKQAIGAHEKNTEQMLGICSVFSPDQQKGHQATNRLTKKIPSKCSVFARYFNQTSKKGNKQPTGIKKITEPLQFVTVLVTISGRAYGKLQLGSLVYL